jgi:hypothetical protein
MINPETISKARLIGLSMVAGAGLMFASGETSLSASELYKTVYSQFYEQDNPHVAMIKSSEAKFMANDIEGALVDLDADFTMYEVTEKGAEERVRGVEATRQALSMSFGTGKWLGASVYKWGLTNNTLAQIEEDHFQMEDGGEKIVKTLVVFEFRDGKRWREWRFKPQD